MEKTNRCTRCGISSKLTRYIRTVDPEPEREEGFIFCWGCFSQAERETNKPYSVSVPLMTEDVARYIPEGEIVSLKDLREVIASSIADPGLLADVRHVVIREIVHRLDKIRPKK